MPRAPGYKSVKPLDNRGVGHAAALADRGQRVPTCPPLELVQRGQDQPRATGTQRMPERNCAAVDVQAVDVDPELLLPGETHRREGLIDLEQVDVVGRQA